MSRYSANGKPDRKEAIRKIRQRGRRKSAENLAHSMVLLEEAANEIGQTEIALHTRALAIVEDCDALIHSIADAMEAQKEADQ